MTARRGASSARSPRLEQLVLGTLEPGTDAQFRDDDSDLDGLEFADLRCDDVAWPSRRRVSSTRIDGLTAARWAARGAALRACALARLDVLTLSVPDSDWRRVDLRDSRLGSAELHGATLRSVRLAGCRVGYLDLREARLTDVVLADCVIDDLDLGRASVTRLALPGTRIGRLEASGATLADADLRGAQFAGISGLGGLRGALVSTDQLISLAPLLAAQLGIVVRDEPGP